MKTINLKDIYPYYFTEDKWIDVPDELAQIFADYAKAEETYDRTKRSCKCQCQNVFFLESQNVQLLEFNVQKNLILIIHLCF